MGQNDTTASRVSTGQVLSEEQLERVGDATKPGEKKLPPPKFGWMVKVEYDPNKGVDAEAMTTPVEEYVKRFGVRESIKVDYGDEKAEGRKYKTGDTMKPDVTAIMLKPVAESKRWMPVKLDGMEALKAFVNSPEGKLKTTIESVGGVGDMFIDGGRGFFQDATALWDTEFIPIMGGPFYKQLYLYDYLKMHAIAFNLVNHNALAAAAVKIMTRFTLGRGVSFNIKDDVARGVWEEFWERTNMKKKLKDAARDLTWQGELMWRYYEERQGYLTFRNIDPSTCWEVVTDPEDIEKVYYYHFQWPTPYQLWVSGKIPISKYIIQQVPPTNVQHMTINKSSMEKRGRSDLGPGMPWLKRFDDYYNGMTLKAVLDANLVWVVKVHGDQADIDALKGNPELTILPPPGGVWLENDAVELKPLSTTQGGAARGATGGIGQQVAATFATSVNLPSEYFNVGEQSGGSARATALVRTDPAVKTIEDRQQFLREGVEEMYDRVLTSAIVAGRIDKSKARKDPEVLKDMPDEDEERSIARQRRVGRKMVAIR